MSTWLSDTVGNMINRNTKYEELPEYLTPDEFRSYLDLGKTTVYDLIERGQLPFKRFGRRIFIPKHALKSTE